MPSQYDGPGTESVAELVTSVGMYMPSSPGSTVWQWAMGLPHVLTAVSVPVPATQ